MGKYFGTDGFRGEAGITCINRREFAICTEKTCHSIGDFPPPRRPPLPPKSSAGNPTDRARRY